MATPKRGPSGQPTRIATDLYAAAQQAARQQSRSTAQQVDHWARIGQGVTGLEAASRRRVEAALAGSLPLDALRPDEQLRVNAELDALVEEKALSTSLGTASAERGVITVALDDDGRLVEYRPDGTTTVLRA